jgi:protein CrcB
LFYLWVAIGGALGSMARAWLAIMVARITGPHFPWGTIFINIIGSFIIGFFGTLTASDSRFAVPADARAFVMIGICGGFTTFSSFSLQTLELAIGGSLPQALGNIGLSVVLCLSAVAAGHYGAAAIRHDTAHAAITEPNDMDEVALIVLNRPEDALRLLDAGTRLLEIGGGGRLKALAVRMPPAASILPSEEVLTPSREASIRAEQERWARQLRRIVDQQSEPAQRRGVHIDWVDVEGDAAALIAQHGRAADAIVVARHADHEPEHVRLGLHAALFDTGSPVLVVPPDFAGPLGHVVAIAWKDDERAVKAVRASIPVLRKARAIHVLHAGGAAEMPPVLREHGLAATLHAVSDGGGSIGERILRAAHDVGADLLVMGAFAHGEWREAVFGGVTHTMLASADLPLLMRH